MPNGDDQREAPMPEDAMAHDADAHDDAPPPAGAANANANANANGTREAREAREETHAGSRDEQRTKGRLESLIPEIVRRTFYAGLGAVFTTEEGIRKIASDLKLPKEMANYLIAQAAASKDELFRVVGKELRGFLESVNISGELQKLLTSLSFEIKTEIRFIPNDEAIGGVKPDMKVGRMSLKRNRGDDKKSDKEKDEE
jgi:hypothetical protein